MDEEKLTDSGIRDSMMAFDLSLVLAVTPTVELVASLSGAELLLDELYPR